MNFYCNYELLILKIGLHTFICYLNKNVFELLEMLYRILIPNTLCLRRFAFTITGISSGSAPLFIRPMDPPQELDFRDNFGADSDKFLAGEDGLNDPFMATEDGMKDHKPYAYNQPGLLELYFNL